MAASTGRKGRPWRRVRQEVLATCGTTCHLCGHTGAGDIDHKIPKQMWLELGGHLEDPANLAPAHGAYSKCYQCAPGKGRACNQAKGDRTHLPPQPSSRDW